MDDRLAVPKWYWVVAVLLLLWGLAGIFAFYSQIGMTYDQMVAAMGKPSADSFAAMPHWQWWAYGIAVWSCAAGAVALLLRRGWAIPIYVISLAAVVIQYGYSFGVAHIQNVLGWSAALFPAFIILVAIVELWFANMAKTKGWLR